MIDLEKTQQEIIDRYVYLISAEQSEYVPNAEIKSALGHTTMVALTGPSGVGKSTIMSEAQARYADFIRVRGFSTRPRWAGESPDLYDFYDHTPNRLEALLDEIKHGELVQFAVHPFTGYVYGSHIEDYEAEYGIADILAVSVEELGIIPYKELVPIGLVTSQRFWWPRITKRITENENYDFKKRMDEAISSIEWMLDQGTNYPIVINDDCTPIERVTDKVARIARHEAEGDETGRAVASGLLSFIRANPVPTPR